MDLSLAVSLLLGIYGAVLSTVLAYRTFWRDRAKMTITLERHGIATITADIDGHDTSHAPHAIEVTLTNTGHVPVAVTEVGFEIAPGDPWPMAPISESLPPGGIVHLQGTVTDLRNEVFKRGPDAKVQAVYVRDGSGKMHRLELSREQSEWMQKEAVEV